MMDKIIRKMATDPSFRERVKSGERVEIGHEAGKPAEPSPAIDMGAPMICVSKISAGTINVGAGTFGISTAARGVGAGAFAIGTRAGA